VGVKSLQKYAHLPKHHVSHNHKINMNERPLTHLPKFLLPLLITALALQLLWHAAQSRNTAQYEPLSAPPPAAQFSLTALGDNILASRVLDLWLQAHDNQPGISIPYNQLDYVRVTQWLDLSLQLDARDGYPLLVASHIYATVHDHNRIRIMLDFIEQKFIEQPTWRWRALADASIAAKHKLKDLPLALRYADTLAAHAGSDVPYWAKDIRLIVLEEMGEKETLRVLIGGLLQNGNITDPYELRFLQQRLNDL
jgi:hypothetical protein